MDTPTKKPCSMTGPTYKDVISTHPIYTGSCVYLGKKSGCKPPIKATSTPSGNRGIPLTGNYNNPGFMLTNKSRLSYAIKYNRPKISYDKVSLNPFDRVAGSPYGSGKPPSNTLL